MKSKRLLPALLLSLTLSLSSCSSASLQGNAFGEVNQSSGSGMEPGAGSEHYDGVTQESFPSSAGSGSYYEHTKVILTANLSLQATDFDGAVDALDALVSAQDGYYENSEYTYGNYYSSGNRWGNFTIRVPRENYQAFLAAVGDVAHLISRSTGTQDVGEAYYDAELHLATLKTKHERLLALLDKAELMEDIISLESALSDVEYQIQQYSSTLTRYDGLIDFATIRLTLQEVVRVTENPTEAAPLSTRISAAFTEGWNNFCDGAADLAVWVAYHLIGVLVFLAVAAAAAVLAIRAVRRRKRRASGHSPDPEQ